MRKFKIFLVSILLISILTTSICLCACEKDDEDWIKVYSCSYNIKDLNYSAIINSVNDVLTICDEDTSPIFDNDEYGANKKAIEALKEYDEEFFKNKALVVFFRSHRGGDYYVKDFEIIDESLNITIVRETKKNAVYPTVVPPICIYILEFDKEKVEQIANINVDEITVYVE